MDNIRNKSILLVDDSQILLDLLIHAIDDAGFTNIDTAGNGVEGLNMAKNKNYDLIITDITMPKMDGFKLLENLKSMDEYKKVPILVLSALYDQESKEKGKECGAVGWITKPFLPTQLIKAIEVCLNLKNK